MDLRTSAPGARQSRSLGSLPRLVRGTLRLIWRAGRREFLVALALQVLGGIVVTAQLLVARRALASLVHASQVGSRLHVVLPAVAVLAGITGLLVIFIVVENEEEGLLGELLTRHAAVELLDIAGAVDLEAYDTPAFHDRLERARMSMTYRPRQAAAGLLGASAALFTTLGAMAALISVAPILLPVTLLAAVPFWRAASRNSDAYYDMSVRLTTKDRERAYLHELVSTKPMAAEVRAYGIKDYLRGRHEALYDERIAEVRRLTRHQIRRAILGAVVGTVIFAGGMGLLAWLLVTDRLSLAGAATAVLALIYLWQQVRGFVGYLGFIYESALFVEDFNLFADLRPQTDPAPASTGIAPKDFQRVVVDHLSFVYPGAAQPALSDVSIELAKDEVVALIGHNGSGKTTLAKLLAQLYRPTGGQILWDDTPATGCDPVELRRSVAVVFQDFGKYWLSAGDNIGLGNVDRIEDAAGIVEASRAAGADPLLSSLPAGYETVLSKAFEGGRDLSIGEWQRVALARAFFRDAPLVIMDEPTAALDPVAERDLFASIRDLCRGRSLLLISHRFSTVRTADRIYVMEAGRIVEHGTHEELVAQGGRYAHLYEVQASSYLRG